VDHPELADHHPERWYAEAYACWEGARRHWPGLCEALSMRTPTTANAMAAALLHQGFAAHRAHWQDPFSELGLIEPGAAMPTASPYAALLRLLPRFDDEQALIDHLSRHRGMRAVVPMRYYLHALNLRLKPQLAFLAAAPRLRQAA
jgi:hypothetical protein